MKISEVWGFLVSRNQFIDYRTVVAPEFICEKAATGILARAAEGDLTEPGLAYYREVHSSRVGDLTLVFRVIEATSENTGIEGNGTLKDSFGREIHLIEGIVAKGIVPEIFVTQETLNEVHAQLIEHYKEFWSQTTSKIAVPSKQFNLEEGVKLEYKSIKEYVLENKAIIIKEKEPPAKLVYYTQENQNQHLLDKRKEQDENASSGFDTWLKWFQQFIDAFQNK